MDKSHTNYQEEIQYRKEILDKVRNGNKVTVAERRWLQTHPVYNRMLDYPYINTDIISLEPNVKYRVRVNFESATYSGRIIPGITVPLGEGGILTDFSVIDIRGRETARKPIKMLGCQIDPERREIEFLYWTRIGLMGIWYECEYFDDKQRLMIRQSSNTGNAGYAMIRELLAENKIRYRCKIPTKDSFDGLVFSIKWEKVQE